MPHKKAPFAVRPDTHSRVCTEDWSGPFLSESDNLRVADKAASDAETKYPDQLDIMSTLTPQIGPTTPPDSLARDVLTSKDTNPKDLVGSRKTPISVIPVAVLYDVGLAMLEGTVKYGRSNYRVAGVRASVYFDAGVGHLFDWWEGDNIDPDSGLSHVTKAIASLVVLRDAMLQGKLVDDRPPRSQVFKRDFSPKAGEIIDRYAHIKPHHCTQVGQDVVGDTHESQTFGPLK